MDKDCVLFLCAHNDDQLIGAGGTIAKYAKEGKKIITIIFSFGETGIIHYTKKESRKTRVKESQQAAKILGETQVHYLGLKEGCFASEIQDKKIDKKIKRILKDYKPAKIFTHANDDPHPDHQEVHKFVMQLVQKTKYRGDVYAFNIWNFFFNVKKRTMPKMIVDISDTFSNKVNAFKKHKSQWHARWSLMWNIYVQAIWYGYNNHVKYAEVFYRLN